MDIQAQATPFKPVPQAVGGSAPIQSQRELQIASQQFEAIFVRQFIDQAMTPLLATPIGGNETAASVQQHMISDALANSLAESSIFGISDILQLHFINQLPADTPINNL